MPEYYIIFAIIIAVYYTRSCPTNYYINHYSKRNLSDILVFYFLFPSFSLFSRCPDICHLFLLLYLSILCLVLSYIAYSSSPI